MTLGQRTLLAKAIGELRKDSTIGPATARLNPEPVTAKSLAKDGELDEILKKIEGMSAIDEPLLSLGVTETPLPRLDNDSQVFLGSTAKMLTSKEGEKPLFIPDFVSVNALASSELEQN